MKNKYSDDGEYILSDPQDFDEYLKLVKSLKTDTKQQKEFHLRMIRHFVGRVYAGEVPDSWVMTALADDFSKVINGGRWEDEFPLPWTEVSSPFSRAEESTLNIYCDIANALKAEPERKVTDTIQATAEKHAVSYEKARGSYYSWNKHFSKKCQ